MKTPDTNNLQSKWDRLQLAYSVPTLQKQEVTIPLLEQVENEKFFY